MKFNVLATLSNGTWVFNGTMTYVPRKGEEIEIEGYVYIVECVRYILKNGVFCDNSVRLILKHSRV